MMTSTKVSKVAPSMILRIREKGNEANTDNSIKTKRTRIKKLTKKKI